MVSRLKQSIPDLARLPITFDAGAVNLTEGLRAALSTAALIAASSWLAEPGLIEAALAALFTCLCDIGGPIRRRLPALLTFGLLGALLVACGTLARAAGIGVALPYSAFVIFCGAFARIYGPQAQQVGMFLSVIVILSLDHAAPGVRAAAELGLWFLLGAAWAILLSLVVWRIHPFQPVRRALARSYEALALMARDLQDMLRSGAADTSAWEFHARAHRGTVRTAIELARTTILDTIGSRGPLSARGGQSLLRLELADQLFGGLIALGDLLETASADDRATAAHMIRRLRPVLLVLGHEILADRIDGHDQISRSIEAMSRDIAVLPEGHRLRTIAGLIIARLKVVVTVASTADFDGNRPDDPGVSDRRGRRWQRLRTPLLANLDRHSVALRHALRAAVTTAPAIAFTLVHNGPFDHWLTITIVVTMQPYFGNTFARAIERAGGTTLGGVIAAAIGLFVTSPLATALAIFPLAITAFAVRAVSFGLFVSGLTPMIVLLVELGQPATSELTIAIERVGLTVAGGLCSIAGCWLLWPSWEPDRLPQEVRAAIAAHGRYAEAELAFVLGEAGAAAVETTRRAAGLATNNVEAAVARAMLEPGRAHNSRLEAAMVIDSALRRMAGRLAAMQFDPSQPNALPHDVWRQWKSWIGASMQALAAGMTEIAPAPALAETPDLEPLARISRQIAVIAGTIARVRT